MNVSINNIEIADCYIISNTVDVENKVIEFTFEEVYEVNTKGSIPNIKLIIYDWQNFTAYKYIPKTLDHKTDLNLFDKRLFTNHIEHFHVIQRKSFFNGDITLEGFSLESSQWIIYEIHQAKISIVT